MDYRAALDYILSFSDFERAPRSAVVFDLRRIEALLARLGNPERSDRSVHIAGTKGKGSTSAMLASILTHSGHKTGLYTSPHLLSFTERIQVNGTPIPEDVFARLTESLKPEVEAVNRGNAFGQLTTFELLTALAFLYFREAGAEYQVLEAGLGGRLDATNVVSPDVCIITSISYDHMDVLGDTLAQIAAEKAGIIKPGVTVVCSPQPAEAMQVIEQTCRQRDARLVKTDPRNWRSARLTPEGQTFELDGAIRKYRLCIPLLGGHQLENAAAAVAAAEALAGMGAQITPESIAAGLEEVRWPGRLQVLRRKPWVVIDAAHNSYSCLRLVEALRLHFDFDRMVLVFGASSDKDIDGMAAELAPATGLTIVTASRNPRSVAPAQLARIFAGHGSTARLSGSVADAMSDALEQAAPADLVCATGSVFVVAEVMEYMTGLASL